MFADISLPVPLDRPFTYSLPETLHHRARPGCRVLVPFGPRKLAGMILRIHDEAPETATREVMRLLDEEPALEPHMIALGQWISNYYCAPLGEVLRTMTPLSGELRNARVYSLTDSGRDVARQMLLGAPDDSPGVQILRLLENRELSSTYLARKVPDAAKHLKSLIRRGYVVLEDSTVDRDPLRAAASRLRIAHKARVENVRLRKVERELLSFLELHPGEHNLERTAEVIPGASQAARSLGRRGLIILEPEPLVGTPYAIGPPPILNTAQEAAFDRIGSALASRSFHSFLLHGVTGSGKTEVYLRSIEAALAAGCNALLLVPEIALTPAMAAQFFSRFGDKVAILHSAFHDAERAGQWRRIRNGLARVVVGTRSGVFAPVQNLGLIIVDEEHDHSYKQQETPRYNGRDVAVVRAQQAGATVLLGSATPSLESRYNVELGKYALLELPDRIERRPMPEVGLIDMRDEFLETRKQATFSRKLIEAIGQRLESGEQVIVLHNRRGFSSFVACRACGERSECINCSVTLTYHKRDKRMLCHYCNYAAKAPSVCPKCSSEYIQFLGTGSERVEEELHRQFPEARIARLDRDTAAGKRRFETILQGFRERSYDILTGTQMIAKGHDIPNVTLVGVVSADIGLGMPDFRAAERTFQLLTQVAGRAGRGQLPGKVLIQTINPDHYAVRMAAAQDYKAFYEKELQFRRVMLYPPFSALANVIVRSEKQEEAMRMAGEIGQMLTPAPEKLKVLGPAEAPVARLHSEFRYQLLLKSGNRRMLNEVLRRLRNYAVERSWPATSLVIDVDPLSLM